MSSASFKDLPTSANIAYDATTLSGYGITDAASLSSVRFYTITEDMVTVTTDATKGVSPYNTGYGYTNITINESADVEWKVGAAYYFVISSTLVVASAYRNVRIRIGESGAWIPLFADSSILAGSSYMTKGRNSVFFYKTTYQSSGALHMNSDSNTTYAYLVNTTAVGTFTVDSAGYGARYSMMFATTPLSATDETYSSLVASQSTATTKSAVTPASGKFYIDRKPVYVYSANIAAGATNAAALYTDYQGFDLRYTANTNSTYLTAAKRVYVWLKDFDPDTNSFVSDGSIGAVLTRDKFSVKFPASTTDDVYVYFLGWTTATYYTCSPAHDETCRIFKYVPSTGEMTAVGGNSSASVIMRTWEGI